MPAEPPCFEARNLCRAFGHGRRRRLAVNDASFIIGDREIVSLVGQSGCGKTVLAKMLLRYPFLPQRIQARIHWQALKLWWSGHLVYPHQKHHHSSWELHPS